LWRTKPTKLFPPALGHVTGGRWWLQKTPTPVKWKDKKLLWTQKKDEAFASGDFIGSVLIMPCSFMIEPDSSSGTMPTRFARDFHA
jgi:hypothetical protein